MSTRSKYFIVEGHTLAYALPLAEMPGGWKFFGVLRSSYRRGGTLEIQESNDRLSRSYRPATRKDFEEFRVAAPKDLA